jgi:ATP/maltotriose-dependent transcriptional regulator MalT
MRAHAAFLEQDDPRGAARNACRLALSFLADPAQRSQGAGWLARAQRLLEGCPQPCLEHGWLLAATAFHRITEGDTATALATFEQAEHEGLQCGETDLVAFSRHGQGRALLRLGRTPAGLTLLDEVMVGVIGGEVGPIVAGVVYCSVISACHDLCDLQRAQEWTSALDDWCASKPDVVPFQGHCLVRRAELLTLHGAWQEAREEAKRANDRLTAMRRRDAGAAAYQLGELHRLSGEMGAAEDAYRLASQTGYATNPGLALLRLAQGQTDAAEASINLTLQDRQPPRQRTDLLAAAVEIRLARGDLDGARAASVELTGLATERDVAFLRGRAAQARGAVRVASGDAAGAVADLRLACDAWEEIDAPYELARARVLLGLAFRDLGDRDGARLEFDAAHEVFDRIGARPDSARAAALATEGAEVSGSLTGREVEVLRLIATGATNRAIAGRLAISEKTVARHISNIFTKLDLPSRAAATAYAYEHKIV